MAVELLRMYAQDGVGDEMLAAIETNLHLFVDHPRCKSVELYRQLDDRSCFVLKVEWDSIEGHKEWAATDALAQWRGTLAEYRDDRTQPLGDYALVLERR